MSLSSLQSVRDFCERYNRLQQPLDYLILNAGIMGSDLRRRTTDDGFEEHFQVSRMTTSVCAGGYGSKQSTAPVATASGTAVMSTFRGPVIGRTHRKCVNLLQVNYLSQWLMAHRLLGEQRARRRAGREGGSDSTRVIFLTSSTHMAGSLDLADLQLESGQYSAFRAYTSSKLAAILAARQMQAFLNRYLLRCCWPRLFCAGRRGPLSFKHSSAR